MSTRCWRPVSGSRPVRERPRARHPASASRCEPNSPNSAGTPGARVQCPHTNRCRSFRRLDRDRPIRRDGWSSRRPFHPCVQRQPSEIPSPIPSPFRRPRATIIGRISSLHAGTVWGKRCRVNRENRTVQPEGQIRHARDVDRSVPDTRGRGTRAGDVPRTGRPTRRGRINWRASCSSP